MSEYQKIKQLFEYREGKLIRKVCSGGEKEGSVAGWDDSRGYRRISVNKKVLWLHRVIWFWHYGYYPENDIDHIDRDKSNNRIGNLREVSRSCNLRNASIKSNNTSSCTGVVWNKKYGNWQAQITVNYKNKNLGYSDSFLEAVCLRLAAEQCLSWNNSGSRSSAHLIVMKYQNEVSTNV